VRQYTVSALAVAGTAGRFQGRVVTFGSAGA
jgi:hypothetical protein